MNCKFCGNFVPDGSDSCSVCGRRPSEEPIGKLLSENQPQNFSPASASAGSDSKKEETKSEKKLKTGIVAPLIAIAVSVAGWLYAWSQDIWDTIKTIFNGTYGESSTLAEDSAFVTGGASSVSGEAGLTVILIIGAAVLLTVIGVIGLVVLVKRLYNRTQEK